MRLWYVGMYSKQKNDVSNPERDTVNIDDCVQSFPVVADYEPKLEIDIFHFIGYCITVDQGTRLWNARTPDPLIRCKQLGNWPKSLNANNEIS